ncbi:DUF7453 family protein [Stieleria maiorica]|uniref:DUF7453 family protein n=1 Tax=Stieleria maiorica TaxID=2795974 RepID=UPI0011C959E3|nr:hypothetical protein [Stieleria maiorica]
MSAQSFTFREVLHSDTQVPGFGPNFTGSFIHADGDEDVFVGSGFNPTTNQSEFGIVRRHTDGTFTTLLDHNTIVSHPVFSGTTTFSFVDAIDVLESDVYFSGRVSFDNHLYRLGSDGTPQLMEQSGTAPSTFRRLRALPNGDVVIHGTGTSSVFNNPGFYKNSSGTNTTIADRNTAVPSGTGTFDIDSFQSSRGDIGKNGSVIFQGTNGAGLSGIYSDRSGSLEKIVDTNDVMPGTGEQFFGFADPTIANNIAYFAAATVNPNDNRIGFYSVDEEGNFDTLVNNATPYGNDQFLNFDVFSLAVSGDAAVFQAVTNNDPEVAAYYKSGSTFSELARVGDQIDGREISLIAGSSAAEDGEFYMSFRFTDNTAGTYRVAVTAVPEPSAFALIAIVSGVTVCRNRRRGRRV